MKRIQCHWPVGILDIGSNSIRMVIFNGPLDSKPAFNFKVYCFLGRNIDKTRKLWAPGVSKAAEAITGYYHLSRALGVKTFTAFATAAMRDAKDGGVFIRRIEKIIGRKVAVISGEQEGHLAAEGVGLSVPGLTGLVCDLGGGSLEIARVRNGKFLSAATLPLGALRLVANEKKLAEYIEKYLACLPKEYASRAPLYMVGGSFRTLARVHVRMSKKGNKTLQGYAFSAKNLTVLQKKLNKMPAKKLVSAYGADVHRAESLPHVAFLAASLMKTLGARKAVISTSGVRDGVLLHLKKFGRLVSK